MDCGWYVAKQRWSDYISRLLTHVYLFQGGEKYQSAFYVYEELASAPSTSAPLSIVGQAVAEIHLGRLPEAEAAIDAALEKYPTDVELIANSIVLNVLAGKPSEEQESYVICSARYKTAEKEPQADQFSFIVVYSRLPPRTPCSPTFRRRVNSSTPQRPSSPPRPHPRRYNSASINFVVWFNSSQGSLSCLLMKIHDLQFLI